MKKKRHDRILEIIKENEIDTQGELAQMLRESGFNVTQATVSRDIRELGLVKVAVSGTRQKYQAAKPVNAEQPGAEPPRDQDGVRHGNGCRGSARPPGIA